LCGPAADAENSDAYERDSVEQSLQKWGHSAFSLDVALMAVLAEDLGWEKKVDRIFLFAQ